MNSLIKAKIIEVMRKLIIAKFLHGKSKSKHKILMSKNCLKNDFLYTFT